MRDTFRQQTSQWWTQGVAMVVAETPSEKRAPLISEHKKQKSLLSSLGAEVRLA